MSPSRLLLFQETPGSGVELYTFIRTDPTFVDQIQTFEPKEDGTVIIRKFECVESTIICAFAYTPSRGFVGVIKGRQGSTYQLQSLENIDLLLTQEYKDRLQKECFAKS